MRRFIADPENIGETSVTITGSDAHHIGAVLRMKPGQRILVSGPGGTEYMCRITGVTPGAVVASLLERTEPARSPGPSITLAQGIPKGRKMDDIVRMACETGVARIVPVVTGRTVVKLDESSEKTKTKRWNAIAREAAKQSGSPTPTPVLQAVELAGLPDLLDADLSIAMWEDERASLKSVLSAHRRPESIIVLTGPEGGLSENEVSFVRSHGFITASLGSQILRTQTAGIAAISAIVYHYSD